MCALALACAMALLLCSCAAGTVDEELPQIDITLESKDHVISEGYLSDGLIYAPLLSICNDLGNAEISRGESSDSATVTVRGRTIEARAGEKYIIANGRCFYTAGEIKMIKGSLHVPVHALTKALGLRVTEDGELPSLKLEILETELASADMTYKEDELLWLARIIEAESGGEVLEGKIAVGNVVLNRVADEDYPSTVWGVIFDFEHGIQFTPAYTGTVYNTPSKESIAAAKICLEGYEIVEDVLFFFNPRIATSTWISENRPFAIRIGNHDFYY